MTYEPRTRTRRPANDNRAAAVDTTVITVEQALAQGTKPWQLRVIANRHTRLAGQETDSRIANQRRTIAQRLRAVAAELKVA